MGRPKDDHVNLARVNAEAARKRSVKAHSREALKRERMLAELQESLEKPLLDGTRLPKKQRERIAENVRRGLMMQGSFPGPGAKASL